MAKWIEPDKKKTETLMKDSRLKHLSEAVVSILANRGYDTPESILAFLDTNIDKLHDPYLFKDMKKAVSILKSTLLESGKIIIYSDFDNDGVCSAALLKVCLEQVGGNASVYTNNRFEDGYGMCVNGVNNILSAYPDTKLIITADNGIMCHESIDYAKSKGIKVIVTDHHEAGDSIPDADAVIDAKVEGESYPFREMCGAGVAFKLMLALYQDYKLDLRKVYKHLDLVALATVGDVVPLVDENRIMVEKGLLLINSKKKAAFRILHEVTALKDEVDSYTLGFIYTPMINAISRLNGSPDEAIEMLISNDEEKVKETANVLKKLNEERKALTEKQFELALSMINEDFPDEIIILYDEEFHEGIVGLLAGKIKERFNRPTIILTKVDGALKGSCRSIDGLHLKETLDKVAHLLERYGGHAKAAGLSLKEENLEAFRKSLLEIAKAELTEEDFIRKYQIDCVLTAGELTLDIVSDLKTLEPYGEGFKKPVLKLSKFGAINTPFYMGKEKNHVKLEGSKVSVIMWNGAEEYKSCGEPKSFSALGYPGINEYNNQRSLQFFVNDGNYRFE